MVSFLKLWLSKWRLTEIKKCKSRLQNINWTSKQSKTKIKPAKINQIWLQLTFQSSATSDESPDGDNDEEAALLIHDWALLDLFLGVHVILFSFFNLRRAFANQVEIWVNWKTTFLWMRRISCRQGWVIYIIDLYQDI